MSVTTGTNVTEVEIAPAPNPAAANASSRRWLVFGTGLGVVVAGKDLEWAVVRSRPSGSAVIASGTIRDFESRPAAEWGAELTRSLTATGENKLVASLLLPRGDVIVRTLHMAGVPEKEIPAAIELQADTLHPFGDEEIAWGWLKTAGDSVLVGLVRKALLTHYETLFSEAGMGLAAVTFSAAAIHAALRIRGAAPASFLLYTGGERIEVYGESEARPVYSAEYGFAPERALALARAELRLAPEREPQSLASALATPEGVAPLAWAAALDASAPLSARIANLLPPDRRASNTRRQYLLPLTLAAVAAVAALVCFGILPAIAQRSYLQSLNEEIRGLEPAALRAQALDKRIAADRLRIASLDDFRKRTQADLDVLNELTRLLPPPVWTNTIEIYPDSVVIAGEADQAAPLLKALDSSPLFQNSEFAISVSRSGANEQFRIKTMRRGRVGRVIP